MAQIVIEKWWHRLTKAALAAVVALATLAALFIAYDHAQPIKHYYSWRSRGIPQEIEGLATTCSVSLYDQIEAATLSSCGQFYNPTSLLDELIKAGAIKRESVPTPRNELSDGYTVQAIAEALKIRSASRQEFDTRRALEGALWVIATLAICTAFAWLLYALLVYIAHGRGSKVQSTKQ